MPCIFCQIALGEAPSDLVHQDDEVVAFRDINPQAPVHIVVIPREHIASLEDLPEDRFALVGRLAAVARRIAASEGIDDSGYRLVINCGPEAGQAVPHLHLHLMGGHRLGLSSGIGQGDLLA